MKSESRCEDFVCVAPDGRLEVWTRTPDGMLWHVWVKKCRECRATVIAANILTRHGPTGRKQTTPEFWGREVLGEL